MAIKAPIELYRRSIPEGLKTKDLFFVALQDRLTVIKPKELNRNEIKIVGYVDIEQGDFTGIQKNCIYLGKGNDRIPFDVYNKNGLKIVGYIPVEGENAYIAVGQLPPPEGGGLWPRRAPIFPTRRTVRHGFCPCYRVQWAFTAVAGGIAGVRIGLCGMESQ